MGVYIHEDELPEIHNIHKHIITIRQWLDNNVVSCQLGLFWDGKNSYISLDWKAYPNVEMRYYPDRKHIVFVHVAEHPAFSKLDLEDLIELVTDFSARFSVTRIEIRMDISVVKNEAYGHEG